ncbi:hypothetical protein TIFTF001_003696 [Ficus carica]|uniref:Pentatricopeptide repeat-containing protein n=1 Tax=Ficus carica TaxID=3494 RepID=A0AA87ZA57_FICCA|nr:hypothetical protein TIFTF001_003696 [Ficus carica]
MFDNTRFVTTSVTALRIAFNRADIEEQWFVNKGFVALLCTDPSGFLFELGDMKTARKVFDEMPERTVVSWKSMIIRGEAVGVNWSFWNSKSTVVKIIAGLLSLEKDMMQNYTWTNWITSTWCMIMPVELEGKSLNDF